MAQLWLSELSVKNKSRYDVPIVLIQIDCICLIASSMKQ